MIVQMEISCFANILQKDAYANVMHVIQMFEPILMEVQKFIAAFLFKNRLSCLTLNFGDHHQEFFRVDQSGVLKDLAQRAWICFRKFHNLIGNEIYESFFLVWLMSSRPLSTVKRDFCFSEFQTNSMPLF